MGKNKKLGNGVDQVQNVCNIETDNRNTKSTENFVLSDNFCVAQNLNECKKYSEREDSGTSFQSLSELGKSLDDQDIENITNTKSIHSVEITSQSLSGTAGISDSSKSLLNNFNFVSAKTNEKKLDLKVPVNERNLNPKLHDLVIDDHGASKVESSSNKCVAAENSCGTKKKNKRKMHKKNSVEEEVEKLIKELDLNDKVVIEPKLNTVIADRNSQHLKNEIIAKDINFKACTEDSSKTDYSLTSSNSELKNVLHDASNESEDKIHFAAKHCESKSLKKKEKRLKIKQETVEYENLKNFNSPDINCSDTSSSKDVASAESVCSSVKEEVLVPKTINESERKGKRPNKKQLALIHEALKKAKEEEEKQRKEAEMKQKMAEEAERIRQEKLRQEQEKKEKKKLKEKQRRDKMKAEGRLLSKSQKQSRARMEATLAALRQQGIEVPQINDKKPCSSSGSRSGNCKNFQRKRNNSSQSIQSNDSAIVISERHKSESLSSQESSGKESLSDLPSSFDSNDDSPLNHESNFSCSDESDGLDDGICRDLYKNKKSTDAKTLDKSKQNKTQIVPLNQIKISESTSQKVFIKYRSPVVCVLGHVDTGKTKLLDYIRKTHVQDSEAGGITQQIGATMIPRDALKEKCKMVKDFSSVDVDIPGLLVIDTPGHKSFSNLRSRGSSICDIAILVVDIMHGLEPQTIESINLLKKGKIPFIVALNKVDRIYGWKSNKDEDIECSVKNQSQVTQTQFQKRCQEIVLQFANECLNVVLFYENKDPRSYISMVPTSAITGDGMGNLLSTVTQLTQSLMRKKLIYSDDLEATVLEVKAIPGLGTTIDVILVNGRLKEGDTIVIAGQEGPIVTQIRSLLMPQPLKELRVKNPYIEHKAVEGAQGIKIIGRDLEKSIAGLPLLVASNQGMIDIHKHQMNCFLQDVMNSIKTSERGVYVQASTLGSLEALLDFLSASGVSYFHAKIGPVVKKDVMKASIMLEHDSIYAAILAFDVKIERDAQELADSLGVRVFHADIIYHLLDMYVQYRDDVLFKRNEEIKRFAVFPCKLRIIPDFVFNTRDPIVLGVCIEQGILKEGTPLCIPSRGCILEVGIVSSIEMNNNKLDCAKKGDEVCITIDPKPGESSKVYGKHFNHEDLLISHISRQSIDVVKQYFRSELNSSDWQLMIELKKVLHVV